ncbi:DUF724 domain-containing protein 1 [Bienertia sinuspersici]
MEQVKASIRAEVTQEFKAQLDTSSSQLEKANSKIKELEEEVKKTTEQVEQWKDMSVKSFEEGESSMRGKTSAVMRLHRGNVVEVFTKKKDPSGVWRCAQIVEDNGDGYMVRYYRFPGITKEGVDKVPTEAVRPRPPSVAGSAVWNVGDVVEVLDDGYWRVSMIEEVLEDDYYHIQVIGSVDEFRVKKSSIRTRQEWKGNQWFPMEKDVGIDEKLISRMHQIVHMQKLGDMTCVMDIQEPVLRSKKRKALDKLSITEAPPDCAPKQRAVDKEVEFHIAPDCYSFTEKVDTSINLRENHCKNKVLVSKETTRINNTRSRNQDVAQSLAKISDLNDCVSSKSSVASCSIADDATVDSLVSHSLASCKQDANSVCSNAESVDCEGDDEVTSIGQSKLEDTLRMHEKELNNYRSTLETLYACGPLSWELEFYLTNLRQKYSVSTDEHLMELRRLKSTGGLGLSCY